MKKYFFLSLSLAFVYMAFDGEEYELELDSPNPIRVIASQPSAPPKKETVLLPAKQNTSYKQVERKVRERVSPRIAEDFQKEPSFKLTRGHVFVSNVGAIPTENYQSSMGEVLYQDSVFSFVRASGDKNLLPVAYSPSTGKLHPISSVLHVMNATEAIRSEVKGLGFQEYYYAPGAKLLSVQSTQSEVLEVYSDLKDRGFEVQLEVVRPHQQGI